MTSFFPAIQTSCRVSFPPCCSYTRFVLGRAHRISSKILRCASYFSFNSLHSVAMKHCASCLIYYFNYMFLRQVHSYGTRSSELFLFTTMRYHKKVLWLSVSSFLVLKFEMLWAKRLLLSEIFIYFIFIFLRFSFSFFSQVFFPFAFF